MYKTFSKKIIAVRRKVLRLCFPENAETKERKGILSEDFRKRWVVLQRESGEALHGMLSLLREIALAEKEYRHKN